MASRRTAAARWSGGRQAEFFGIVGQETQLDVGEQQLGVAPRHVTTEQGHHHQAPGDHGIDGDRTLEPVGGVEREMFDSASGLEHSEQVFDAPAPQVVADARDLWARDPGRDIVRTDLMRGTLDLLILRALTTGPDHGLGIARRVEQITQGAFRVNPGSLFPALHRLAQKGWLTAEWGRSETNRKAKYYELTPDGRHQLEAEARNWKRISVAIDLALDTA